MTLSEFLLARIAEDEAVAEAGRVHDISTCPAVWHGRLGQVDHEWSGCECGWSLRLQEECEAKRRIVEFHRDWPVLAEGPPKIEPPHADRFDITQTTLQMTKQIAWMTEQEYRNRFGSEPPTGPMLKALAMPYADHPDFLDEWRI